MDLTPIVDDLKERMERTRVPGAALTVIAGGEVVLAEGYGVTSVEDSRLPMTADTISRAASISKSLTATMVMRLVDRGQLDLDRPVIEYLPGLRLSLAGAAERALSATSLNRDSAAIVRSFFEEIDAVLGILDEGGAVEEKSTLNPELPEPLAQMVQARQGARESKDWARSDELRDDLVAAGVTVTDTPAGPTWTWTGSTA